MIRSMTAYGRGSAKSKGSTWVIEIHSVNRRTLEISMNMPKELLRYDIEMRKWIGEKIQRGQITLRAQLEGKTILPAQAYLVQLKKEWQERAKSLGFDPKDVDLTFLAERLSEIPMNSGSAEQDSDLLAALQRATEEALKNALQMKEREGVVIEKDTRKRLKLIQKTIKKIAAKSGDAAHGYREKLQQRFSEFGQIANDERLLREMVIFAEKLDITEEITRLGSHIDQLEKLLSSQEKSVGRNIDFLIQEMNREVNTIASKSADSQISLFVVDVKAELEKIREQMQNVE